MCPPNTPPPDACTPPPTPDPTPDPNSTNAALIRQLLADRPMPCPACGYQLQGIASDRCPECGVRLHIQVKGRGRVWLAWSLALLTFLIAAALCVPEVYDDWIRRIGYQWERLREMGDPGIPFAAEHATFIVALLAIALLILIRKRLFRRPPWLRWSIATAGTSAAVFALLLLLGIDLFPQPRLYGISHASRARLEAELASRGAVQNPSVREIVTIRDTDFGTTITRRFIDADGALVIANESDRFRTTDPRAIAIFNRLYESPLFEQLPKSDSAERGSDNYHVRSGTRGAFDAIAHRDRYREVQYFSAQDYAHRHYFLYSLMASEFAMEEALWWEAGQYSFPLPRGPDGYEPVAPEFGVEDFLPLDPAALGFLLPYDPVANFEDALHALDTLPGLSLGAERVNELVRIAVAAIRDADQQRASIKAWITHHADPHHATTEPGP